MKILLLTLAPVLSREAPAVQVANMAQAFSDLGHDVTVVATVADPTIDAGQPERLLGFRPSFRIMTLSRRIHRGQSYLHALRIARLARRGGFDLVFSRNLRGALLPALRGVPTVFEAHTLSSLTGAQDRRILARLLRTPGFRGFVAISQGLTDDLVGEFAVDADRVLTAHDAVRMLDARTTGRSRAFGAAVVVGYTGSLFPGKGADALLDIAGLCPWAEFIVAGGPDYLAAALRQRGNQAGLTNVTILGPLDPSDARGLQRDCDVLVAPFARRIESDSGHDIARWTSPMKVFEYMASGRPIVISDLPVLREVLRPDVDALMVPPEDPDALIAALERLRDDPELGNRLAASALERVRTQFTWELRARRILERFVPEAA